MRELHKAGVCVQPETAAADGHYPITLAAEKGYVEMIQMLADAGADVNCRAEARASELVVCSLRYQQ